MSSQVTCLNTSAQSLRQQLWRGSPVLKQPSLQLSTGESGCQEAEATWKAAALTSLTIKTAIYCRSPVQLLGATVALAVAAFIGVKGAIALRH